MVSKLTRDSTWQDAITEVEHKNSTIENLFNVIRKLMPCAEGDTTYNNNVYAYNENVSKFNSTPMKKDFSLSIFFLVNNMVLVGAR